MPSLPVPVEVLETVLRFVPVNENFRLDQPANQNAPPESRDKAFSSVRINKFWRLQFAYKQWMEIVQLHLGEFELKMSASCDPDQEVGDDEAPIIWNKFVAFNLSRDIDGIKGLDHLGWSYLNAYVASVKLFYHIPPSIGSALCKARLARTLKQISAFFVGQQLSLDLRLRILEVANGQQLLPVPPGAIGIEIPSNISTHSLSVSGVGPYVGVLQSLLISGQASLKSLSADVAVLLPALKGSNDLILPNVTTLKLPTRSCSGAQGGVDLITTVAKVFPGLVTLQLPSPENGQNPAPLISGAVQAAAAVANPFGALQPMFYQPQQHHQQYQYPQFFQQHMQQLQQQAQQNMQQANQLLQHVQAGQPNAQAAFGQGAAPLAMGMAAAVAAAGAPGAPAPGVAAALDLRPLTGVQSLEYLSFTWPLRPGQSILAIEHEAITSLHLQFSYGTSTTALDLASCQKWIKVAKGGRLENLELNGLGHRQLAWFAVQMDSLPASIDFGRLKTVRLAIAKQEANEDCYIGVEKAFAKFNLYFTALQSVTLELKHWEVPDNFSRFVLENVPEQIRHLKLVNVFQNTGVPLKQWKGWIFNIVANIAISLPRVAHVEIDSPSQCYEGLADVCNELAGDARLATFDFGAYATVLESVPISRLRVSKQTSVADSHVTSVKSNYKLQFFLKQAFGSAVNWHEGDERQISFLFKDVQSLKLVAAGTRGPHPSAAEVPSATRRVQEFVVRFRAAKGPQEREQVLNELQANPALYRQYRQYQQDRQAAQAGASSVSASANGASSAPGYMNSPSHPQQQQPPQILPGASESAPSALQQPSQPGNAGGQ